MGLHSNGAGPLRKWRVLGAGNEQGQGHRGEVGKVAAVMVGVGTLGKVSRAWRGWGVSQLETVRPEEPAWCVGLCAEGKESNSMCIKYRKREDVG